MVIFERLCMAKLMVIGNVGGEIYVPKYVPPPPGGSVTVPAMNMEVGGSAANTAITVGRLGISTAVAGVIGDDTIGYLIRTKLQSAGVDVTRLSLLEGKTSPMTLVETASNGVPIYVCSPGTNSEFALREVVYRTPCQICHLAAPERLVGAWPGKFVAMARRLRASGKRLTLDVFATGKGRADTVKQLKSHRHLLELVEVVFANEREAQLISGRVNQESICNYFHKLGTKVVVIKRGAKGALVSWTGGIKAVAAAKTKVVDTIGAGDAFAAGFLGGLLRGLDPLTATAMGCTVAGLCVRAPGALAGTADKPLLQKAMALRQADL